MDEGGDDVMLMVMRMTRETGDLCACVRRRVCVCMTIDTRASTRDAGGRRTRDELLPRVPPGTKGSRGHDAEDRGDR